MNLGGPGLDSETWETMNLNPPLFVLNLVALKHGSWLDQAKIEISLFSRQCLGQRRIPSLSDLQREAKAWNRTMNRNHVITDGQFSRRKARKKHVRIQKKHLYSATDLVLAG